MANSRCSMAIGLLPIFGTLIVAAPCWAQQHPADPEIQQRLDEMERLEAADAAQLKVDRAIVESKDMIRQGSYRRAVEILTEVGKLTSG